MKRCSTLLLIEKMPIKGSNENHWWWSVNLNNFESAGENMVKLKMAIHYHPEISLLRIVLPPRMYKNCHVFKEAWPISMLYSTMKYIHVAAYSTEVEMNNPELYVSKWKNIKCRRRIQEDNIRVSLKTCKTILHALDGRINTKNKSMHDDKHEDQNGCFMWGKGRRLNLGRIPPPLGKSASSSQTTTVLGRDLDLHQNRLVPSALEGTWVKGVAEGFMEEMYH